MLNQMLLTFLHFDEIAFETMYAWLCFACLWKQFLQIFQVEDSVIVRESHKVVFSSTLLTQEFVAKKSFNW